MFQTANQYIYICMGQNLVPLVNLKIAGKWMFITLKMVLIGIDPYPYGLYIMDDKPQILSGARRFRSRAMCHGQLLMAALKAMKFTREAPGDGRVLGMATEVSIQ